MDLNYEIPKAHVCQNNVYFKTSFVLIRNLTDKVILGLPFIALLYPFTTEHDGIVTYPFEEPVKFKFLSNPEPKTLKEFQKDEISKSFNLITCKNNHTNFLKEEIKFKRIENQLDDILLQER